MKKFFAIYLSILCTFPILTNGNVPCSTYSSSDYSSGDRAGCLTHGGCQWFDFDSICSPCPDDEYHPACSDPNSSDCQNDCLSCISDGNWTAGAQPVPHSIFDINNTATGLSSCPWVCTNGYFKGNNNSECLSCPDATHPKSYETQDITNIGTCTCPTNTNLIKTTESDVDKYYCGTCGDGGMQSQSGDIYTCSCQANVGVNNVHGATDNSGTRVECACPSGATWSNNRCECSANKYLSQGTDGVYSCISCPSNGNCPEGSTWESATCATGYKKVPNTTNHTFTCESCSNSNATLDGNVCKCNAGYYGTQNGLNTECAQCPIGTTTTTIGATQRSDCEMNHNTKFCYGSGDNKKCMNLIPAGTVISVSNNT